MKLRMNRVRWGMAISLLVVSGIVSFGSPALAGNSAVKYPARRIVTGVVMSVSVPVEKGRDGEIMVDEKNYRLTPKTVMVDENDQRTDMKYFKEVSWVYMVVNLYEDRREVLFVSPAPPRVENPVETSEGEAGKPRELY